MRSYSTMLAGLRDLVDNPTPRVPVLLCLDTSSSMSFGPIRELNAGVHQFISEMKSDDLTLFSAEIAVVTFASEANCIADFNTADRLNVPELLANGYTAMGEGIVLGLDMLEQRKAQYKNTGVDYYQPILVIMSDGAPNGDPSIFTRAVERIHKLVEEKRLITIAVGIGTDADMEMLAKVSPKQPPARINGLQFREFFAWLSQSVSCVSASQPDDEPDMDFSALEELEKRVWDNAAL